MKAYAIVRFNRYGQPAKFYDSRREVWEVGLNPELLFINKDWADKMANAVDGYVVTYKIEMEKEEIYR